jgi:hypothetical protein
MIHYVVARELVYNVWDVWDREEGGGWRGEIKVSKVKGSMGGRRTG